MQVTKKGNNWEKNFELVKEMDDWYDTWKVRDIIPFYNTFFMEKILEQFYCEKKQIKNFRTELGKLLSYMREELSRLENLASWGTTLDKNVKREDVITIRSSVEAFESCPVIKKLTADDNNTVTAHFYGKMEELLTRMAVDQGVGEKTATIDYDV